jgi:hypothetical protein
MSEDLDDPEANQNKSGSAGKRPADQAQSIVAVKKKWPKPIFLEFSHCLFSPRGCGVVYFRVRM